MRRFAWFTLAAAGAVVAATAIPSTGAGDTTAPYGPFGFVTRGMGQGPQYGEPSMIWAPDGRHGVICTPGSDGNGNGTVQYWYTTDGGHSFHHSISTAPNGGGDCDVDYLPGGWRSPPTSR